MSCPLGSLFLYPYSRQTGWVVMGICREDTSIWWKVIRNTDNEERYTMFTQENSLQVFENPEFGKIRIAAIDGEPWFVGKDVATALGYADTKSAITDHVDADDKKIIQRGQIATLDIPNRGLTIINESGLYGLTMSSKLPDAKRFKRWVTHDVLPSIRKTGGYFKGQEVFSVPKDYSAALRALADEVDKNAALEAKNAVMQPKADYFDDLVDRNTLTGIRETANEFNVPQKKFVNFLLENNFLYRSGKRLMPYADAIRDGLFYTKERKSDKTNWSGTQVYITPQGRVKFWDMLQGTGLVTVC